MWDKSVVEIDVDEGHDWDILDINEGLWLHLFSFFRAQDSFADLLTSVLCCVL